MSNRTMLEFNHDFAPRRGEELQLWAERLLMYLSSGDPALLPEGVTWFGMRHHSSPCKLGDPPRGWQNNKPSNEH